MTKMGARVVAQTKQRGARDARFRHEDNTTIATEHEWIQI